MSVKSKQYGFSRRKKTHKNICPELLVTAPAQSSIKSTRRGPSGPDQVPLWRELADQHVGGTVKSTDLIYGQV